MAKVECEVDELPGRTCSLTCGDCDHSVELPGQLSDEGMLARLFARMKKTCPEKLDNKYVLPKD
jgi:hypothetical protein